MADRLRVRPGPDNPRRFWTGIANGVLIVVAAVIVLGLIL